MVISFFKINRPISVIALPLIALILWGLALYQPAIAPRLYGGPLYGVLFDWLHGLPIIGVILGLTVLVVSAFLLNHIATTLEILNSSTQVTGLMYVVLMSLTPSQTVLHPALISNLFILMVLNKLIGSYRKETAFEDFFDIGFLLGIATLFYIPSFVFIPMVWIGLLLIRPFVGREWVIGMVGFILPFILATAFFFLFDQLQTIELADYAPGFSFPARSIHLTNANYFTLVVMGLVVLLSLTKIYGGVAISSLRSRKNINILLWALVLGMFTVFMAPVFNAAAFSFCAISGAVFLSNYFLAVRKEWWTNFLFYLLCACSIVHHIVYIF